MHRDGEEPTVPRESEPVEPTARFIRPTPTLPAGRPADQLLAELRELRAADAPTRGGRTFAYVYDAGLPDVDELAATAYGVFATVNGLDPTVFPSVARLENDVVGAVSAILGVPGAQGSFTSGGTESILLAVKTARDHARVTAPRPVGSPVPVCGTERLYCLPRRSTGGVG